MGPKWIEEKEHLTIIVVLGVPQDVHLIRLGGSLFLLRYLQAWRTFQSPLPPFCKELLISCLNRHIEHTLTAVLHELHHLV
jgi:hypothetical protein